MVFPRAFALPNDFRICPDTEPPARGLHSPAAKCLVEALLALLRSLGSALGFAVLASCLGAAASAQVNGAQALQEYVVGPGDIIKVSVFQNNDLTLEVRVSEAGMISFPLIGAVPVGGMSIGAAEKRIAQMLKSGGFLVDPQVSILIVKVQGNQVAMLGQFARPGRYPLETAQLRVSDLVAEAGGIAGGGADVLIFSGMREGKSVHREIDIGDMYVNDHRESDILLQAGDVLFVDRYPVFYIYGEVQRPGSYRIERNMTVLQALAVGGGLTQRGTQRGLRVKRRDAAGKVIQVTPDIDDAVRPNDVLYVRESIF